MKGDKCQRKFFFLPFLFINGGWFSLSPIIWQLMKNSKERVFPIYIYIYTKCYVLGARRDPFFTEVNRNVGK